ncbi:bifunctional DedA family/phosphatase PAP2 family protein [Acidimangrovimonas sediminis]|uniref:bifunctional DedA family/phosphatase PAP2 family protein n=1 Tax=Acidimangrovimonas sediminis TaxID=2056283 RepID=UPI000C8071CB|nr:bifunctional DedA family/phosphatase PAP2 family protein [Acidimangrovimonas sediminis]
MPHSLDQLLPSLQSLGVWSYWITGFGSLLEGFFATGIIAPGTLMVDAAGILAQRGYLDVFDLFWFVAIGSILGGELSYWTGRWSSGWLFARFDPETSRTFRRARDLFVRRGGVALGIGRFLGPVAGFVPLAAALAGMKPRRFRIWNALGALPYAAAHLALGYFFGNVLTRMGPLATRALLFAAGAALLLGVILHIVIRIERRLPTLLLFGRALMDTLGSTTTVRALRARHPRLGDFLAGRFDTRRASGLPATLLAIAFAYVLFIYLGSVLDFLMLPSVVRMDHNVAALMLALRDPRLIALAAYVTAFGIWQAVSIVLIAAGAALWLGGRRPLVLGLLTSIAGNVVTVALLKLAFHRARPPIGYFVETSGSFPSGHAAISVACYGMLAYIAWRVRMVGPILATLAGLVIAFLIGLSRIYLIEHYLSDVLNGYLVGTLWLVIGVSVAEWLHARTILRGGPPVVAKSPRRVFSGILVVALAGCGLVSATYQKPLKQPPSPGGPAMLRDVGTFFATNGNPAIVYSIDGYPLAPVNLLVLARNKAALEAALTRSGYAPVASPTPGHVLHATLAELFDKPDPRAPTIPAFWNQTANALVYVGLSNPANGEARHLVRIWPTRWRDAAGEKVFVVTATRDDARPWDPAEKLSPDVDTDRKVLSAALVAHGGAVRKGTARLPQAAVAAPHRWHTDGGAAVLSLP